MIKEIHIDNPSWDEAVKKYSGYDVYYISSYMKAFQIQGYGEPVLLIYSNGSDYAVSTVFKRDVANDKHFEKKIEPGKYYDISAPYGYGGFIGTVSDWDRLEDEWTEWCREENIICEFERFNLFSDYRKYFRGEVESRTHNVVRSLNLSKDDMWMDFKQKVRKNVRRANKYDLEIIVENEGTYLDDFLRIYYGTMERTDAEDMFFFKREFFETINQMKDNICYFHTVYNDDETGERKIISTELVIYGSQNVYSYLGGTDREYFDMRPNDFLKWEIIKWAKEKGLRNFVLGGGYGSDDGIFEYKKCLAPNGITDFYIGRRILDEEKYNALCRIRSIDRKSERYFPAYRAE